MNPTILDRILFHLWLVQTLLRHLELLVGQLQLGQVLLLLVAGLVHERLNVQVQVKFIGI